MIWLRDQGRGLNECNHEVIGAAEGCSEGGELDNRVQKDLPR